MQSLRQPPYKTLLATGLLAVGVASAEAGSLRFTIEAPGIQTSQVPGTQLVETFDALTPGTSFPSVNPYSSVVGSYTRTGDGYDKGTFISSADPYGGAGGTGNYLETNNLLGGNLLELDLTGISGGNGGVGYFGFWWSAGDGNNELVVTMKDGTTETFVTQSILNSAALQGQPANQLTGVDGHYGNPNYQSATVPFSNGIEAYAFVNIFANNDPSRIARISFRELPGNSQAFESDNHTVVVDLIDPGDQTGQTVPVPATAVLLGAGLGLLGWLRRRGGRGV